MMGCRLEGVCVWCLWHLNLLVSYGGGQGFFSVQLMVCWFSGEWEERGVPPPPPWRVGLGAAPPPS